jgi:predicted naringenin-chalcone synthase
LSKIISIATRVPGYKYTQEELLSFADDVYMLDQPEQRKLRFLYRHSGITNRYSVLPDFNLPLDERIFFPPSKDLEPFPDLEARMAVFNKYAPDLSVNTINDCIEDKINKQGFFVIDLTYLA